MTWKGVVDVQVNQLNPIWDGSKRKRKQIDLFGFGHHLLPTTQLKPAATATRGESKRYSSKWKLPMRYNRKLPMLEEQLEKELEKAKEPLEKANPPPVVCVSTRFCRNARPQFQRGLIDYLKT